MHDRAKDAPGKTMPGDQSQTLSSSHYAQLGPEQVLHAVEAFGFRTNGHLLALNSFENRVYKLGLEEEPPIVAKFYRPNRWTDEQIIEEHTFAAELAASEIPVIAPLAIDGATLLKHEGYRFTLFPCVGGRAPDLENREQLEQLARFIARMHLIGQDYKFSHRPQLNIETFGRDARDFVLASGLLPDELTPVYESLTNDLLVHLESCYQRAGQPASIRCHGDSHAGNLLIGVGGPQIVDLDDARMAPRIQDLWMLLPGDADDMQAITPIVLDAYSEFSSLDARELHLIEALRTLRIMHYYAWLARRWDDPAFPIAFPWFNSQRCWEEHVLTLREQTAKLFEPPPVWLH